MSVIPFLDAVFTTALVSCWTVPDPHVGANSRCGAMSDVATTRLPRTVHRLRGVDGEAVLRAPGT